MKLNADGAIISYGRYISTKTYGQWAGVDIDIDDSFGYALQAGLDYMINDKLFINLELRYIDIEADVKANGVVIGKAEINPTTVGVSLGYRF